MILEGLDYLQHGIHENEALPKNFTMIRGFTTIYAALEQKANSTAMCAVYNETLLFRLAKPKNKCDYRGLAV